jgi:threonine dehydratase
VELTPADVEAAAHRIAGRVHCTPLCRSRLLDQLLGCQIVCKAENLQRAGSFKIRGATNAVLSLDEAAARRGVITHSSGNFAQALALAAAERGVRATVVMPRTSVPAKLAAVRGYGGIIVPCEPTLEAREATARRVVAETGGTFIHPYDQPAIIAGQGTAALELLAQVDEPLDLVVAPVGGGGLLAGTALAVDGGAGVWGAEPAGADDAHRSLAAGRLIPVEEPDTIADGLRTSLGQHTFPILLARVAEIACVRDTEIVTAMRLLWERLKLVVEPSGAVPLAVAMRRRRELAGRRVGLILSGGNVDLDRLPW